MTLIDRCILDGSLSSPFRVSAAGVDANRAEFNTLIFDGNQSPLRLWSTGWGTVAGMTYNELQFGKNINEATIAGGFATPAGTSAVFATMWRNSSDSIGRLYTPSVQSSQRSGQGAGGGAVCSGLFIGTCWSIGTPTVPDAYPPPIYVNYCIFKDYR